MKSEELAWKIRRHAIEMTHLSKESHIGSALSAADIVAVLYNNVLRINPENQKNKERDRFILSKGHAGIAVYAALAEKGFFPVEELKTHCKNGSRLSGHVSHENVPGVEVSTGSLGHGLGVGAGIALAGKYDKTDYRVFVLIGDGECEEGAIWEAALFAKQFNLFNLTVIVDHNHLQALKDVETTLSMVNLADKWKAFGWDVQEINGHDHDSLKKALLGTVHGPSCIIAETVKGKGISFMENQILWHYRDPQGDDYKRAVYELESVKP